MVEELKHPNIFISYCWTDGTYYADELEKALKSVGIHPYRDKSSMNCSDDMDEFMAKIADCDNVVLVITGSYLHSQNCMMEMAYLVAQPDWYSKSTMLIIDNKDDTDESRRCNLYDHDFQMTLVRYWRNKAKELRETKSNSSYDSLLIKDNLEQVELIIKQIENFIYIVTHHLNPSQIGVVQEILRKSKDSEDQRKSQEAVRTGERLVKEMLEKNGNMTIREISEKNGMSPASVHRYIQKLLENGEAVKIGSNRHTHYEIVK